MEKIDFCFLILHYKDAMMTEQTVSSILSLNNLKTYKIVIVDNASPDDSGDILIKKYKDANNIFLLKADKNGGFSKGNNLGYQFIKENFSPEFLICANNDVQFVQKDFLNRLVQLYVKSPFYVCGPDIYIPWRDFHSNPLSSKLSEHILDEVDKEIEQINKLLITCNRIFSPKIFKLYFAQKSRKYMSIQKIYRVVRKLQRKTDYMHIQENVILCGACLIFDKRYIDEAEKLFEPETFLYKEEHILSLRCQRNHWNTVYFPEIVVNHLHEGNSNLGEKNYKEFCVYLAQKANYRKEALIVLKKYIEEGK